MQRLLAAATPTLREIAQMVGLSYASLRAYSRGSRAPTPQTARKLAKALRARAAKVVKLADELDALADRDT